MLRSLLTLIATAIWMTPLWCQIDLTGQVVDAITQKPINGVKVISGYPDRTITDESGYFTIRHQPTTQIHLHLIYLNESIDYDTEIDQAVSTDLGSIAYDLTGQAARERELPSISLEDADDRQAANISGLLQSGEDIFSRITSYTFSPSRFDRRGLDGVYTDGYLNYIPVNDLESDGVYWSTWGGLNEVMRRNDESVGAESSEWGFGGLGSTFNTDLRAASQWRQKKISYAVTNRNYRNRLMATWSTGLSPSGWALSLSGSRRWAQEGYTPGTFYDAWSYFISVDKKINDHHSLNFVALGAPYKRGGSSTNTAEMVELAGDHYYNSYWGYQQGEKRSGRYYSGHQPLFLLRYDWKINQDLNLTAALGYQTGTSVVTALDWLFASDPRPDYYRRLPSFQDNPEVAEQIRQLLTSNKSLLQIQWDDLYQSNYANEFTIQNVNGIAGESLSGHLSNYILESRITDIDKKSGNVVLNWSLSEKSLLHVGATAVIQKTRNYKEVEDLLGGEFYVDWDKYAQQDFPGDEDAFQNDLLRPNRPLYEGDQFGYDYDARVDQYEGWIGYEAELPKWEFGVAGTLTSQTFWRVGHTQNGKFPDNSLGKSESYAFLSPGGKALIRYKLDGRNYITVSGIFREHAPLFDDAFVSPRTRDNVVAPLEKEQMILGEVRYDLRAPYLKASLGGYFISTKHALESTSFYHDDLKTFVNFSLTGVDKQYTGIEAAVEYTLFPGFAVQGAASVGQYIYTSRPKATITQDNNGSVVQENVTIYAKNFYVSGTPQQAYTVGLSYRTKDFWSFYLNVNHFADNWINFNPIRRTTAAVDLVEPDSDQWKAIIDQEKTEAAWTLDVSVFKSFRANWLVDGATISLNASVTNLLNNQDYINGGYEQYRYDFEQKDPDTFPSRYSYMQGLNYFLQASLRF